MECTECKYRKQIPLKRCKHFELGGDKKRKVSTNMFEKIFKYKILNFELTELLFSGSNDSVLNYPLNIFGAYSVFNKK